MSHFSYRRRNWVDSRLLVVGSQIASLTLDPSFAHNLGCRCPNGSCKAILDIYTSRPFQQYKKNPNARCFNPCNQALKFWESRRTLSSHFWECEFHPHISPKWGCDNKTHWPCSMLTQSQFLERLKCESKQNTTKKEIETRSLTHNTLRGKGACWSSGMGLGRVNKLHSLTQACTKPTQGGQCIVGALLVLGRIAGNMDTQDSSQLELGGSHHLPPYSILFISSRGPHPNGFSLPGLLSGSLEIAQTRTPMTLESHNFANRPWIEVQSKTKLQAFLRTFQRYVTRCLQISKLGRFPTFSGQESNWQFDSQPFLAITCVLDVQMSNASPFQTAMFQEISNDIKNITSH